MTLGLAAPALAASAWLATRGSLRAAVVEAGLLLYMAYTYATYAFGVRFNALFLAYCAILGASTYGLFLAVPRLLAATRGLDAGRLPRRALVLLLYGVAGAFALLWGSEIVAAMVAGEVPRSAAEAETPTSFVHVLDLAFLLPLGALAATLLAKRRAGGAALAGVFLVKALTIALAVLSMALFAGRAGQPVNAPVAGAMVVVVLLVGIVGWKYARALPDAPPMVITRAKRPSV